MKNGNIVEIQNKISYNMKYVIIILAFLLSGCTPEYSPTKYFVVTDLYPGKKVFHISQKT